jgi:hypothetical protein
MQKLELLLEKFPEKVMEMVDNLYRENIQKKSKTIFHFEALGKRYDSNKFVDNYLNFIKDVFKIHPYEFFKLSIDDPFIKKCESEFSECHKKRNQIKKISDGFYLSTYSDTETKIKHIESICDYLGAKIIRI